MFSYTDPVYQQQANSPTKEVKLEDLQRLPHHQSLHPINTNSYLTSTSSAHNQSSHVNNSNHAANHVNSSQNNQTSHVNSNQNNHVNNNSSNPLYPYNDMLYSIDHQQQPQMTPSSTYENHYRQQSQGETQLPWQDNCSSQAAQTANNRSNTNSFYPDIRNHPLVDHNPPFDHYNNASPFSSPVPHNNTNVLMSNNHSTPTSQRSSLQSLPSIPPIPSSINNTNNNTPMMQQQQQQQQQQQRPRITTSLWDDEGTVCYQVDVRGICVARRQDNDMVNGTKLLNVTGMSRGKRDGILKNEKGRVVVKVGAMHLKGVWITFARAKALAIQFNIAEHLHPLFVDEPAMYFYSNQLTPHNYFVPNHPIYLQSQDSFTSNNNRTSPSNSSTTASNEYTQPTTSNNLFSNMFSSNNNNNTYNNQMYHLPSAPPVPSMIPYGYGTPTHSNYSERTSHSPTGGIDLHYSG